MRAATERRDTITPLGTLDSGEALALDQDGELVLLPATPVDTVLMADVRAAMRGRPPGVWCSISWLELWTHRRRTVLRPALRGLRGRGLVERTWRHGREEWRLTAAGREL